MVLDGSFGIVTQGAKEASDGVRKECWLNCNFCGHHFSIGQKCRFILSTVPFFPNGWACLDYGNKSNEELMKEASVMVEEVYRKFWWALDDEQNHNYHFPYNKAEKHPYYTNEKAS
jgi:hypothetical protein